MINTYVLGTTYTSTSADAYTQYEKSRYGEKKGGRIEYSGVETLYLVRNKKMIVHTRNKTLSKEELLKKLLRTDKRVETKIAVYQDLRKKGYIVKTALKFGTEFRVYEKGVKPGEDHAQWIVTTVKETDRFDWHEFAGKNRIAHSTRKKLLIAILDEEGDISYYACGWERP